MVVGSCQGVLTLLWGVVRESLHCCGELSESFHRVVGSCQGVLTLLWGVVREF